MGQIDIMQVIRPECFTDDYLAKVGKDITSGSLFKEVDKYVALQNKYDQALYSLNKQYWEESRRFRIKELILHDPATIIYWEDGTKTVVKCSGDELYDPEKGIALCFMKKACGNIGKYNNVFKKYIQEDKE